MEESLLEASCLVGVGISSLESGNYRTGAEAGGKRPAVWEGVDETLLAGGSAMVLERYPSVLRVPLFLTLTGSLWLSGKQSCLLLMLKGSFWLWRSGTSMLILRGTSWLLRKRSIMVLVLEGSSCQLVLRVDVQVVCDVDGVGLPVWRLPVITCLSWVALYLLLALHVAVACLSLWLVGSFGGDLFVSLCVQGSP